VDDFHRWWANFTEGEAIALMHKAFDLGVTLFDAGRHLRQWIERGADRQGVSETT